MPAFSPAAKYVITIIGTLVIGFGSSLLMGDSLAAWYPTLIKPAGQPPPWVFGPAWTVLYILMGTAAGMVWGDRTAADTSPGMVLYCVQLLLNAAWTAIFFGLRMPGIALAEILVLLAIIIACAIAFGKVRSAAGWLLVPYILWVTFATYLNAGVVVLN